jgi:hypothetical protein
MSKINIKYDFKNDYVTYGVIRLSLEGLRDWISVEYAHLLNNYKVKTIRRGSTYVVHYDWEGLLDHARHQLISLEYIIKNRL